jgi:hypothetical protein
MRFDFTPFAMLWALLALVVLALIAYRKIVSLKEDDTLHLGNAIASTEQVSVAHKLDQIDKWGKLLTVIALVYGLLLAAGYTYQIWQVASGAPAQ